MFVYHLPALMKLSAALRVLNTLVIPNPSL